jgi:3-hydroxyisobutyrate dehydrogenase
MVSSTHPRVGFVGVGKLGRPMAQRLVQSGFDLIVFDTDNAATSQFEGTSVSVAKSLDELVVECNIISLCLPGPDEMEKVMFGKDGVEINIRPGTLVIDHTTNSPTLVRQVEKRLKLRKAAMVDAPVSGGVEGAAKGSLTTLIGGDSIDFERARVVVESFSNTILHVGSIGAGTVAKLMNNLAAFALDQIIVECLTIGVSAGIEANRLLQALQQSAIGKGGNLHERIPATFMKGDFKPRFTLNGAHKDLHLAVEMADEGGVPIRIARNVLDDLETALSMGLGDRDASIAMTLQEERSGIQISTRLTEK